MPAEVKPWMREAAKRIITRADPYMDRDRAAKIIDEEFAAVRGVSTPEAIEPWMYDFIQSVADDCFDDEHYTDEVVSDLTRRLAAAYAARGERIGS